jgi:hypothetical protein
MLIYKILYVIIIQKCYIMDNDKTLDNKSMKGGKYMKSTSIVQFGENEVVILDLEQKVKRIWGETGKLQKDIKDLRLYVKTEENMVYYVINDVFSGCQQLSDKSSNVG